MEGLEILIDGFSPEGSNLYIAKGKAKAILPEERNAKFYQWGAGENGSFTGARDFDTALSERIILPREHGMLVTKGAKIYDDRKLRYDGISKDRGDVSIYIAPTHFYEVTATNVAAEKNPEFKKQLREKGASELNDKYGYFASPFSVSAVPVTAENHAFVFRRKAKAEIAPGYWHVVGGFLDPFLEEEKGTETDVYARLFSEEKWFDTRNPSEKFRNLVSHAVKKELEEEADARNPSKLELTTFCYGITAEFTHTAHFNLSDSEFEAGIQKAKEKEHEDYKILKSSEEIAEFLESVSNPAGNARMVSTGYAALLSYLKKTKPEYALKLN